MRAPAVGVLVALVASALSTASASPIESHEFRSAELSGPDPALVARTTLVGRSVKGRPIAVTRISVPDAAIRRRVLVIGCVHGDECAGRAIVERLRARALGGELPRGAELLLVRNMNPDGFALRRRQNARGVDLNRNGSAGRRYLGPRGTRFYAGRRAWSEPETRAIRALVLRARPDVVVFYHQPLGLVDVPEAGWAGRAGRYAKLTGLPVRPLPAYPGSMSRWINARVRAGSAFVVELPGGRLRASGADRHARAVLALAAPG